jgi:vacuolar-type H+-ATPase subunit I/STV1
VLHRLSHFIKLGLSNRAVKTFDFITLLLLATVFSLCCGALISSWVGSSYYASVGAKAAAFPVNATASEISKATASILDQGNNASTVQHYMMCSTIGAAFLALITSAAFALRGIRKTFTLEKLSESADVRRVRNQIYAFCLSVFVSYLLQFWCAAASSPSPPRCNIHACVTR